MVPVRKPGRPLSTCACPPGPCQCSSSRDIKVAIPRNQKCGCGTEIEETDAAEPRPPLPPVPPYEAPVSPTRPSFRVSKSSASSRPSGRMQSFDPANMSRIELSSINLRLPQSSVIGTDGTAMAMTGRRPATQALPRGPPGYDPNMGFAPPGPNGTFGLQNQGYVIALPYGTDARYIQQQYPPRGIKAEQERFPPSRNGSLGPPMQAPSLVNGSRDGRSLSLGGSHQPPELRALPELSRMTTAAAAAPPPPTTTAISSCCANKVDNTTPDPPNTLTSQPGYGHSPIPPYSLSGDMNQQGFQASFEHPTAATTYRYPASYGSWQQPVDHAMWEQIASQPNLSLGTPLPPPTDGNTEEMGLSHQCSCGAGCQCIGCIAHPFNEQTLQYVNNAYHEINGNENTGSNGSRSGLTQAPFIPESPPEAQTPSDSSAASEEQALSTVDYFFVNIPLNPGVGSCRGNETTCPCGDECTCTGCLIHNSPAAPLEE
jgi:hypothetical protein